MSQTKAKGIKRLSVFELLIILSLLLLKCGDVETNPGPDIDISLSSPNFSLVTGPEKEIIKSKFSFVHYNVQSLVNKVELIEGELHDFDVICLTETWLDMRTLNYVLKMVSESPIDVIVQVITTEEFVYMSRNQFVPNLGPIWKSMMLNVCGSRSVLNTGNFSYVPFIDPLILHLVLCYQLKLLLVLLLTQLSTMPLLLATLTCKNLLQGGKLKLCVRCTISLI